MREITFGPLFYLCFMVKVKDSKQYFLLYDVKAYLIH